MRLTDTVIALIALVVLLGSCGRSADAGGVATVFAAASLTEAFQALAEEFERSHPEAAVRLHFAGTPQLVLQLREGAPADVFASADEVSMGRVVALGSAAGEPVTFARNRLAIVTAKGNDARIAGLTDLARPDLRVVLCGPEVPAGRYARQVLERAGVTVHSVSDESSVKAVVAKIALGEIDAGIVYATDAASARGQVEAVAIPPEQNIVASYPIVALDSGRESAMGRVFVAFVASGAGREILQRFGFGAP